jgi:hypothetical protein
MLRNGRFVERMSHANRFLSLFLRATKRATRSARSITPRRDENRAQGDQSLLTATLHWLLLCSPAINARNVCGIEGLRGGKANKAVKASTGYPHNSDPSARDEYDTSLRRAQVRRTVSEKTDVQ